MYLDFPAEFLPVKQVNKQRAVSQNPVQYSNVNNKRSVNPLIYNMCSVHFDRINISKVVENKQGRKSQVVSNDVELLSNNVTVKKQIKYIVGNQLSNATQQKMSKAIKYLNFTSSQRTFNNKAKSFTINFKLAFVTLTLSSAQVHSDNEIKSKLLNQLFIEVKKKYNIKNYVWRSEKQGNGNVHFHVLFDNFIPHAELRTLWNRLQNKLGYVDSYADKMSKLSYKEYESMRNQYKVIDANIIRKGWVEGKKTRWRFPNSTDIHSLQYITSIDAYLIKYMSKSEQNKGLEGRLWGCSSQLSNLTGGRDIVDSSLSSELNRLISDSAVKNYIGEYFQVLYFDYKTLERLECVLLIKLLREWLIKHFELSVDSC